MKVVNRKVLMRLSVLTISTLSFLVQLTAQNATSGLDNTVCDFGRINVNQRFVEKEFMFYNDKNTLISITSTRPSSGAIRIIQISNEIPPHAFGKITIYYDLYGSILGPKTKSISVYTNYSDIPFLFKVIIDVVPAPLEVKENVALKVNKNESITDKILFQNDEHLLSYFFFGENIIFTIEDFGDFVDNLANKASRAQIGYGSFFNSRGEKMTYQTDMSLIEIDKNFNFKLERGYDRGYFYYQSFGFDEVSAAPHYISDIFLNIYNDFRRSSSTVSKITDNGKDYHGVIEDKESKALVKAKFISTNSSSSQHVVYKYIIPLREVANLDSMKINIRFYVLRCGKHENPMYSDKEYFFPEGQTKSYESAKFFTIDLKDIEDKNVITLINERKDQILTFHTMESDFKKIKRDATLQAVKNGSFSVPAIDGLYIQLTSKKYIELSQINTIHLGSLYDMTDVNQPVFKAKKIIETGVDPFIIERDFLKLPIVQVKRSEFLGIIAVAGSYLKYEIDILSLHPLTKYPFWPKPKGKFVIYDRNDPNNWPVIMDEYVYWPEKKVLLTRSNGESWSYRYQLQGSLTEGYYCFWINKRFWFFEILPG